MLAVEAGEDAYPVDGESAAQVDEDRCAARDAHLVWIVGGACVTVDHPGQLRVKDTVWWYATGVRPDDSENPPPSGQCSGGQVFTRAHRWQVDRVQRNYQKRRRVLHLVPGNATGADDEAFRGRAGDDPRQDAHQQE